MNTVGTAGGGVAALPGNRGGKTSMSSAATAAGLPERGEWGWPGGGVAAKAAALKALARACCPLDGDTPVPQVRFLSAV